MKQHARIFCILFGMAILVVLLQPVHAGAAVPRPNWHDTRLTSGNLSSQIAATTDDSGWRHYAYVDLSDNTLRYETNAEGGSATRYTVTTLAAGESVLDLDVAVKPDGTVHILYATNHKLKLATASNPDQSWGTTALYNGKLMQRESSLIIPGWCTWRTSQTRHCDTSINLVAPGITRQWTIPVL